MLLVWAVSCEAYELHEDGTADIFGAGFDTFYVESLPARLELTILARVLMAEDERANLDLHILGPNPTALGIASVTYELDPDPGPNHRPGYLVAQTEVLKVERFRAEMEGPYVAEIYVDPPRGDPTSAERRRSLFFSVRLGSPE